MRKKATYLLVLFCLSTVLLKAQSGNPGLKVEITFQSDSITKSELLDSLARRYALHFSYNPELLEATEKVKASFIQQPLYRILDQLIDKEKVTYKAFDNQIVLFPLRHENTLPPDRKTIRGTIISSPDQQPIPYCNITIKGKALGTMSNQNGKFSIKLPEHLWTDTLAFSALGYETAYLAPDTTRQQELTVVLNEKTYALKTVDVVNYKADFLLGKFDDNYVKNYETDYTLFTTFYRELTIENDAYTDISEAVLQVMKAPYHNELRNDHVKFIKGRKGAEVRPYSDIRFKLLGGPYYITQLDVVKNNESFLNAELRHLYDFHFERMTFIGDRQTAVVSFKPVFNLRDILFEGELYIDMDTWAVAMIEFGYTRQGLKDARNTLIHKEPKNTRAIPTELTYTIQYKLIDEKWYLLSARSSFKIKINDRGKREKTRFHSISEMLTTNIEKGDLQKFSNREIFKSNEVFTDKIVSYDPSFWEDYNIIEPEEELVKALRLFDDNNLIITYKK